MIYLFTGSDEATLRSKAFAWVAAARAKAPDAWYLRLDASQVTEHTLIEALGAQGLFYQKSLVLLDDPLSKAESKEVLLEKLPVLAESTNVFAIVAPKTTAKEDKELRAHATKVFTHDKAAARSRGFNSALVNALAARNGKALWIELMRAYREGDAPEMLHGLLHWKARELMSKGDKRWTPDEARAISRELIMLLSESRRGGLTLELALERFALSRA